MDICKQRLMMERKNWRKSHPYGFTARLDKDKFGNQNLYHWICTIPGKQGGIWEDGNYKLHIHFPQEYPNKPPKCAFDIPLFHPNIYPSGTVCLSILNEDEDWRPSITIKEILIGIQNLLDNPNPESPAQADPYQLFVEDLASYIKRVKEQIKVISVKI